MGAQAKFGVRRLGYFDRLVPVALEEEPGGDRRHQVEELNNPIEDQLGLVEGGREDNVLRWDLSRECENDLNRADFGLSPAPPACQDLEARGLDQERSLAFVGAPEGLDCLKKLLHQGMDPELGSRSTRVGRSGTSV